MTTTMQIMLGSCVLALCSVLHVGILVMTVALLRRTGHRTAHWTAICRAGFMLGTAFAAIVFAHTVQVWVWAFALLGVEALEGFDTAIYFALVTSTTVGYGDLTLGEAYRTFGAFAGVTGLLTFGLSTALLVGLFERVLPRDST